MPGQSFRTGTGWGPCAESRGELGCSSAGGQATGVWGGELGGGARGLWKIHVCIWQSARSQLSEAGPLASCRGGRQGPGDTPPPKPYWCPLFFPRLSHLSMWMTQTLPSHPLRVLGSMLQGWGQQVPLGYLGQEAEKGEGEGQAGHCHLIGPGSEVRMGLV